jgi:hypothetical protein
VASSRQAATPRCSVPQQRHKTIAFFRGSGEYPRLVAETGSEIGDATTDCGNTQPEEICWQAKTTLHAWCGRAIQWNVTASSPPDCYAPQLPRAGADVWQTGWTREGRRSLKGWKPRTSTASATFTQR